MILSIETHKTIKNKLLKNKPNVNKSTIKTYCSILKIYFINLINQELYLFHTIKNI